MWKLKLLSTSCYKIMFFLGFLDMSSVFVNSIMTGYFAMRGAVFCTNPVTLLTLGAFGCGEFSHLANLYKISNTVLKDSK